MPHRARRALVPATTRNQRDDMLVEQTGLHHLSSAACSHRADPYARLARRSTSKNLCSPMGHIDDIQVRARG